MKRHTTTARKPSHCAWRKAIMPVLSGVLSIATATSAMAQATTGGSVSPSTYSSAGDILTFTLTMNSGNELVSNPSASSAIGVSYVCSPSSSSTLNVSITCSGTYTVQPGDLGAGRTVFENATGTNRGNQYSPSRSSTSSYVAPPLQSQTITFTDPTDIATASQNQSVPLSATASSGLSVAFSSATSSVCSVSGSTATVLSAGICTINANQNGNGTFLSALQVSQSFTIGAITDVTAPVVTVPANISMGTDTGAATATVTYSVTFSDNNPGGSLAVTPPSGSTFPIGISTVSATATDAAGNMTTETFTVTVADNEQPAVTVPANITTSATNGQTSATVTYAATVTDNVPGASVVLSPASGSSFNIGTTTVTATGTDVAGNQSVETFTVTVEDNEAPVVTVPSDISVDAAIGAANAVVTFVTSFTDNAAGGTLDVVPASGTSFPIGITTVTATATDASGNTDIETFTVTVNDTENPITTVPNSISTSTDPGSDTAVVTYSASFTDNAPGGTLVVTPPSGTAFPVGRTTVAAEATDASGNTDRETFTVTVADNEAPSLTVPSTQNVNTDPGEVTAVVNHNVTFSDNVAGATLVLSPPSGTALPLGATTVTATVTDVARNVTTDMFTVNVSDNEAPSVSIPSNINVSAAAGLATADVNYNILATDNDAVVSLTVVPPSGTTFGLGATTVTVTAIDTAGNQTIETFTVTVSDTEAPMITLPANIVTNTDAGSDTAIVTYAATFTDNVAGGNIVITPPSGTAFAIGETTVTVQATDAANNVATETFTVTVTDGEAPVLTVPEDITVDTDLGLQTAVVTFAATVTDNAPGASVSVSPASGTAFAVGTTTVTATATDVAGNSVTDTFSVTVEDKEAPAAPVTTVSTNSDGTVTVSGTTEGGASVLVTFPDGSQQIVTASPTGVFTVTSATNQPSGSVSVTSTDTSNNTSVATSETFTDTTPPVDSTGTTAIANLDKTVTVSGVTEPGAEVTVTFPDGSTQTTTAGSDGRYSITSTTAQSTGEVQVVVRDAAGNQSGVLSAGVSVDRTPPEQATAVNVTTSADNAITVSGTAEAGASVEITFPDGSQQTVVASASGAFSATSPDGQPSGDVTIVVIDAAGNRSEVLATRHNAPATLTETQEQIATYLQTRAGHVVSSQPDLTGLLSGNIAGAFNANATKAKGDFHFRSRGGQPVWALLQGSWSETDGREASYYFGAVGGHVEIAPDAILGFMIEFDRLSQTDDDTSTEGSGYLVGPYAVAKIPGHPLYIEGRYLVGKTDNEVKVDGTPTQDFETERTLASVKVAGQLLYDDLILTPSLGATHYTDTQDAFTDTADRRVAQQEITVTDVALGLDFEMPLSVETGEMTLFGGVSGIWSEMSGTGFVDDLTPAFEGQRGRVHLGSRYDMENGIVLNASASYDGIGTDDYSNLSVQLGFEMKF